MYVSTKIDKFSQPWEYYFSKNLCRMQVKRMCSNNADMSLSD